MKPPSKGSVILSLIFTLIYFTSFDIAFVLSLNIYPTLRFVLIFAGLMAAGLLIGRLSRKLLIALCFVPFLLAKADHL